MDKKNLLERLEKFKNGIRLFQKKKYDNMNSNVQSNKLFKKHNDLKTELDKALYNQDSNILHKKQEEKRYKYKATLKQEYGSLLNIIQTIGTNPSINGQNSYRAFFLNDNRLTEDNFYKSVVSDIDIIIGKTKNMSDQDVSLLFSNKDQKTLNKFIELQSLVGKYLGIIQDIYKRNPNFVEFVPRDVSIKEEIENIKIQGNKIISKIEDVIKKYSKVGFSSYIVALGNTDAFGGALNDIKQDLILIIGKIEDMEDKDILDTEGLVNKEEKQIVAKGQHIHVEGGVVNFNNGGEQNIKKQKNKIMGSGKDDGNIWQKEWFRWLMGIVGGIVIAGIVYFIGWN